MQLLADILYSVFDKCTFCKISVEDIEHLFFLLHFLHYILGLL